MNTLKFKLISLALIALMAISACNSSPTAVVETEAPTTVVSDSSNLVSTSTTTEDSQDPTNTATAEQSAILENDLLETHESESDYSWNEADVVEITLADDSSSAISQAVRIEGNQVIITAGGTYRLTGTLSDGQILVESVDDDVVRLIFNGVNINCDSSAPVYIKSAEKTVIILVDGTQNLLTDTANYVYPTHTRTMAMGIKIYMLSMLAFSIYFSFRSRNELDTTIIELADIPTSYAIMYRIRY